MGAVAILGAIGAPASAGKTDDLAACMWEKVPQSANDFVSSDDQVTKTKGLFAGMVACGKDDLAVNTKKLKKALLISMPKVVGENKENPMVFTCIYENGECKPVEED
jgi:hypothetical protein